jgi:hypothetical protein
MINNNSNNIDFYDNIKFVEKHIGGTNKDSPINYNNQSNLITNTNTDYQRILDYNNKLQRDKNKSNEYAEKLDNEQRTTVYRINNYPTYVDDVNVSNPLIYPKEHDMYFDYLDKKNLNPINTQVVKEKNYINIDSSNRNINTYLDIEHYINLPNYSLEFINQQNYFNIYLNNADKNFKPNDFIILRGFSNYENYYEKFNFFFTNGSSSVITDLKSNFLEAIPYYDIYIKISGVTTPDSKDYWKNIPLGLINQLHKVYITNINGDNRLGFNLPIFFYSENDSDTILTSNCICTFLNLGNYPINLIQFP